MAYHAGWREQLSGSSIDLASAQITARYPEDQYASIYLASSLDQKYIQLSSLTGYFKLAGK